MVVRDWGLGRGQARLVIAEWLAERDVAQAVEQPATYDERGWEADNLLDRLGWPDPQAEKEKQ